MDTENLKIKTYSTAIKNLPDYPSDAGYTAAMLKEAFDARSDNEIKEKHNALVEAMSAEISELKTADEGVEQNAKEYAEGLVSEHDEEKEAHSDIRELISEVKTALDGLEESAVKNSDINNELSKELNAEQMANPPSTHYAHSLIERLEEELGTMPNDTGHSEKMVRRANTAFYADEAAIANQATKDGDGNRISTTYATKAELGDYVKSTDIGTEEKTGVFRMASVSEAAQGTSKEAVLTPYHMTAIFEGRIPQYTNGEINEDTDLRFPPSTEYVIRLVGDISSALDELHAYAEALVGGAE